MEEIRIYSPGVFDLFHIGHLNFLNNSKLYGTYLLVGVCSDKLCFDTKSKYPINNEFERLTIVYNIKSVNDAIIYRDLDYIKILKKYNINKFVVGEEFGNYEWQQESIRYCNNNSIQLIKIKRTEDISTTDIIDKIKK